MKGSLPSNICNSKILSVLALDGLYTASVCRHWIFKSLNLNTYYSKSNIISGGIPDCIYNMTSLNTLLLSGNGINGYMVSNSDSFAVSPSLQNLVLSNNQISGTIPKQITERSWENLDLSNNKFTGTLESNFHNISSTSTLSLQRNRISGKIPSSLINAVHINILNGNIFFCLVFFKQSGLPIHDINVANYSCGSFNFDVDYIIVITVIVITIIYLRKFGRKYSLKDTQSINKKRRSFQERINSSFFDLFMGSNINSARDYLLKAGENSGKEISNITRFCEEIDVISFYFKIVFFFIILRLLTALHVNSVSSLYTYTYAWVSKLFIFHYYLFKIII